MKHHEGEFTGANNVAIYFQHWQPEQQPRAVFLIAHGAAEHSGRYERFARHFVERGYAVAALDLPDHGRSDGTPGHVDRFSDYLETLEIFQRQITAAFSGVPQVLLGHSMGGLISTSYLLQHQDSLVGCVLSGPAIKTDIKPGVMQMLLIRFLSAFFPKAGALQLDANGVSRDPKEVELYLNDPLVYTGKLSARMVFELFKAMDNVQANAASITLPLLMLHGGADALASPESSRFLDSHVSSTNKVLHIYPSLYHEIFNEPEREEVFADIEKWCGQLLEQGA